jgi:hypothetical protein
MTPNIAFTVFGMGLSQSECSSLSRRIHPEPQSYQGIRLGAMKKMM